MPERNDEPKDPESVKSSLKRWAKSLGMDSPDTLQQLYALWSGIVGEAVAEHTAIDSLKDGVLVVRVDDPSWLSQLRFHSEDLAAKLNAELGQNVVREVQMKGSF